MKFGGLSTGISECFEFGKFLFINSKFKARRRGFLMRFLKINPPFEKVDKYFVYSNGTLINQNYRRAGNYNEKIFIGYENTKMILNLTDDGLRYNLCDEIFYRKFPQSSGEEEDLSQKEISELEDLIFNDTKRKIKKSIKDKLK